MSSLMPWRALSVRPCAAAVFTMGEGAEDDDVGFKWSLSALRRGQLIPGAYTRPVFGLT